jgi:hypothetical protein
MMTQVYDMRRLHMGCGESLQHHLPLPIYGKRYHPVSGWVAMGCDAGEAIGIKKSRREEKR